MNNIKNSLTIQDLELLCGIKAHSIRIWEKRYGLLNPSRINRNVRTYSVADLQKILNISFLYKNGHKVSVLAKFTEEQLLNEVKKNADYSIPNNHEVNSIITSMYTFDSCLFEEVYSNQIKEISFEKIFTETYLPLLNHIGILWQTESVKPVHEHFISNLIYQKIILNTAAIKEISPLNEDIKVLFLPEGEIHEIGLLFLNYYLKLKGHQTIYLGRDIPFDNLSEINSQFNKITWISYFLIDKPHEVKEKFLIQFESLLANTKNKCIIFGEIWEEFTGQKPNNQIIFYKGISNFVNNKVENI